MNKFEIVMFSEWSKDPNLNLSAEYWINKKKKERIEKEINTLYIFSDMEKDIILQRLQNE